MGLSERRNKQRLVGAASGRNTSWASDVSLPGQRLLAGMGWSAGRGLGSSARDGTSSASSIAVKFKMDNKGIGVDRAERDARAKAKEAGGSGALDAWATQGARDFGSLLERLNAAASSAEASGSSTPAPQEADAASSLNSAVASSSASSTPAPLDEKAAKRARKEARRLEKEAKKADKKRESDAEGLEGTDKSKKQKNKGSKKSKVTEDGSAAGTAVAAAIEAVAVPTSAAASTVIPGRLAHRVRYLRAKRQVASSGEAQLNEIFGISSASSATASPAPPERPPRMAPGPAGSSVQVMLKQPPPTVREQAADDDEESTDDEVGKEEGKLKKGKKKAQGDDDPSSVSSGKKDKKRKRGMQVEDDEDAGGNAGAGEEGRKKSKEKRKKAKVTSSSDAGTLPPVENQATASDPSLDPSQSNLRISSQGVFEYLSNRLILRKAAVMRARKQRDQGVWDRVAAIGA
ncbi:hypothetical protein K437DRAFT_273171 [Tilletiaria anomala UBC 951]|uniref:G-patch domain-containing protein n=1 Tax=Tilletiaria anomala (strain ATCC 24038 / CBS 436.72 / UBC 951) TaxID=1037660 RepID=A0A066W875_TILAU|nr:uncharacterized protein K437DRAFT_273171 [Tilletiaria anomala UBC 951]KDN49916.1 hypothetical protein K437DRAFT_273171 [Tilletiaria anomala UBC 951]